VKIALVIAVAAALHPGQITFDGVAGVKIGMTVAQAEQRVGHQIKPNYNVSPPCGTATLSKRDRVYVLLDGKIIKRIDVRGTRFKTTRGVRVGDSVSTLLARYPGKLVATRNFYTGDPQYEQRRGRRKIVFFTNGRSVTQISTGAKPEIDYIEGCA
jgi:hypothetical protein